MNNNVSEILVNKKGEEPITPKITPVAQQFRESALLLIVIVILTISLIGCAPATPFVVTVPTTVADIPTATPTILPTETPTPFPTQTPFNPKATIKIVVHVPLSGGGSRDGTDIERAVEMAVQQLAGPLTELGYKIELVSYDDQASVDVGVANAKAIVANPEILCGVGHYNANVTIQSSEVYHHGGLAFVSPANTTTTVTDRVYPEVNRVVGRDDGQGTAGAQFANAQGFKRVYVIHNNASYSEKSADYFMREAYRIGVSVVGVWTTDQKENFDSLIRRMIAVNPDLVYFASRVDQASAFFREARAAGYTGAFLSTDGVNRPALVELAGPSLVEGGGMYYTEVVAPAGSYPDAYQFVLDFESRYGSIPRTYAAQAYDATGICMKAIEEASKVKGGELPTRKDVANAIRALQDYNGITGTYSFNYKGDPTPAKYYVFKVVSPDPANWDQNTIVATFDVEPPR